MSLKIIYGRAGTGKSKVCFEEIKNKSQEKKVSYMITPEQFSFTAEQKLLETLDSRKQSLCRNYYIWSYGKSCIGRSWRNRKKTSLGKWKEDVVLQYTN